jgi:CheY-like chemotaxis protein
MWNATIAALEEASEPMGVARSGGVAEEAVAEPALSRGTILVADDSSTIRQVVELTFAGEDLDVRAVADGEEAIELLRSLRPALVIADVVMPRKNGYEVCEFVRSLPELKHVPVLLLSGAFESFDPARAARVGGDAHMVKPFQPQSLVAKVRQLLGAAAAPRS